RRAAIAEHPVDQNADKVAKFNCGRGCRRPIGYRKVFRLPRASRFDGLDVKPFLIAEIVINCRNVAGAGSLANLADGSAFEALFGEELAGGSEQSFLGIVVNGHDGSMNQLHETSD